MSHPLCVTSTWAFDDESSSTDSDAAAEEYLQTPYFRDRIAEDQSDEEVYSDSSESDDEKTYC